MSQLFKYNMIALLMVAISRLVVTGLDFDDFSVGNYLWLPIGAAIMSYLLFDFKVFPGVFIGYMLAEIILEGGVADISQKEVMSRLMSSIAPIIAIGIMKQFSLSKFFDADRIVFSHIIFLVLLSAVTSTLLKTFFVYHKAEKFLADPIEHISSYLLGDMIGGVIFIVVGLKIVNILAKRKSV